MSAVNLILSSWLTKWLVDLCLRLVIHRGVRCEKSLWSRKQTSLHRLSLPLSLISPPHKGKPLWQLCLRLTEMTIPVAFLRSLSTFDVSACKHNLQTVLPITLSAFLCQANITDRQSAATVNWIHLFSPLTVLAAVVLLTSSWSNIKKEELLWFCPELQCIALFICLVSSVCLCACMCIYIYIYMYVGGTEEMLSVCTLLHV